MSRAAVLGGTRLGCRWDHLAGGGPDEIYGADDGRGVLLVTVGAGRMEPLLASALEEVLLSQGEMYAVWSAGRPSVLAVMGRAVWPIRRLSSIDVQGQSGSSGMAFNRVGAALGCRFLPIDMDPLN